MTPFSNTPWHCHTDPDPGVHRALEAARGYWGISRKVQAAGETTFTPRDSSAVREGRLELEGAVLGSFWKGMELGVGWLGGCKRHPEPSLSPSPPSGLR